jgi:hypothetical protein
MHLGPDTKGRGPYWQPRVFSLGEFDEGAGRASASAAYRCAIQPVGRSRISGAEPSAG